MKTISHKTYTHSEAYLAKQEAKRNANTEFRISRTMTMCIVNQHKSGVRLDFFLNGSGILEKTFRTLNEARAMCVRSFIFDGATVATASRLAKGVPNRTIANYKNITGEVDKANEWAVKNSETIAESIRRILNNNKGA